MHLVQALAHRVGQALADRVRDAAADRVGELIGIEAAEQLLLDQRRADRRAEPLAQYVLDVLLQRLADVVTHAIDEARAERIVDLVAHRLADARPVAAELHAHPEAAAAAEAHLTPAALLALAHRRPDRLAHALAHGFLDAVATTSRTRSATPIGHALLERLAEPVLDDHDDALGSSPPCRPPWNRLAQLLAERLVQPRADRLAHVLAQPLGHALAQLGLDAIADATDDPLRVVGSTASRRPPRGSSRRGARGWCRAPCCARRPSDCSSIVSARRSCEPLLEPREVEAALALRLEHRRAQLGREPVAHDLAHALLDALAQALLQPLREALAHVHLHALAELVHLALAAAIDLARRPIRHSTRGSEPRASHPGSQR